jgi:hypothetical protein
VAARVRARWAALEALERASASAFSSAQPAEAISGLATAAAVIRTGARMDPRVPGQQLRYSVLAPPDRESEKENEKEKENAALSMQMQVDGHASGEKPLPPRPAALGLRINPGSEPARAPASAATTSAVPMSVDGDATPRNDEGVPTSDSTLRTTPTSLTCFEKESLRPVLQRRPTRALTPPQVRRRPSITDELEEAVRSPSPLFFFPSVPVFNKKLTLCVTHDLLSFETSTRSQREEATLAMLQTERTDGLLRCPRWGCNELLSGVRALTFHLHIHAVSAGAAAYTCVRCGGAFESARDVTRHACARRRARGAFF